MRDCPDPEDADGIDESVVKNAVGETIPERVQSLHATKRQRRLVRLCQYYLWFDRSDEYTLRPKQRRRKAMEMVVAEFDDTNDTQMFQAIYQAYQDIAEGETALEQFEADLEALAVKYDHQVSQS